MKITEKLLDQILDINDYSWIKVGRWNIHDYIGYQDYERILDDLEEHHIEETAFLINMIRALAQELKDE
jgi:hypothetical protein